ncbi:hypothetical protein, partial [Pseudomonas lactis]|uniref:hypothetical protein n=1 Tax=Pseudomonas lactis TaxID=1615674 RepID=UPI001CC20F05
MEHPCRPHYYWITPFVTEYSRVETAGGNFEGANPTTKNRHDRMDFPACVQGRVHGYNRPLLCPQNMTNRLCLLKINMWELACLR